MCNAESLICIGRLWKCKSQIVMLDSIPPKASGFQGLRHGKCSARQVRIERAKATVVACMPAMQEVCAVGLSLQMQSL